MTTVGTWMPRRCVKLRRGFSAVQRAPISYLKEIVTQTFKQLHRVWNKNVGQSRTLSRGAGGLIVICLL